MERRRTAAQRRGKQTKELDARDAVLCASRPMQRDREGKADRKQPAHVARHSARAGKRGQKQRAPTTCKNRVESRAGGLTGTVESLVSPLSSRRFGFARGRFSPASCAVPRLLYTMGPTILPTSGGAVADTSSAVLSRDGWLLLLARFVRLFSYGWLAVALILFLVQVGLDQWEIGLLFTATLLGDLLVTFLLSTTADSWGRRKTLLASSLLKAFAGVVYAFSSSFWMLLFAGFLGIISPTGGEIGPFLAVEQASLTESITRAEDITKVFGWYQFLGYLAQALGAVCSGLALTFLQRNHGWSSLAAYRFVIMGYATFGIVKFLIYSFLSSEIEPLHAREVAAHRDWFSKFGLHRPESRTVVFKLSCLFILDAFAGGFVMQSIIVYCEWGAGMSRLGLRAWIDRVCSGRRALTRVVDSFFFVSLRPSGFHEEYALDEEHLGLMMMGANVLAGLSALAATPLVSKIGAINTMVRGDCTHAIVGGTSTLHTLRICLLTHFAMRSFAPLFPFLVAGVHAFTVQHPAAARAVHALPDERRGVSAAAIHHQPDGRACATDVRGHGRGTGGAQCGRWYHLDRAQRGSRFVSVARWLPSGSSRQPRHLRYAFHSGRWPQVPVRHPAVHQLQDCIRGGGDREEHGELRASGGVRQGSRPRRHGRHEPLR